MHIWKLSTMGLWSSLQHSGKAWLTGLRFQEQKPTFIFLSRLLWGNSTPQWLCGHLQSSSDLHLTTDKAKVHMSSEQWQHTQRQAWNDGGGSLCAQLLRTLESCLTHLCSREKMTCPIAQHPWHFAHSKYLRLGFLMWDELTVICLAWNNVTGGSWSKPLPVLSNT